MRTTQEIKLGDSLEVLARLPAGSVHCVVTSPPYWGLRDYGVEGQLGLEKEHDCLGWATGSWCGECYVCRMVILFRQVWRVLRDDGTLWLNIGDSYASTGCHSGQGASSQRAGRSNVGIQNARPCVVSPGLKPKDLCLIPARLALALQAGGWYLRSQIIWAKGVSFCDSYSGAVMPESCLDRPSSAHELVYLLTKSGTAQFWTHRDRDGVRTAPKPDYRWVHATGEEVSEPPDDWKTKKIMCPDCQGTRLVTVQLEGDLIGEQVVKCEKCRGKKDAMVPEWTRVNLWQGHDYYYDQEAVRERSNWGRDNNPEWQKQRAETNENKGAGNRNAKSGGFAKWDTSAGRNLRNVWTIGTQSFKGAHFATFPEKLVQPCVKAGTSERGVCPECGAPWARVVENGALVAPASRPDAVQCCGNGEETQLQKGAAKACFSRERRTTGWRPTCEHDAASVSATVLDPFGGSGTVAVVCADLGRSSILVELNQEYAEMAEKRIADATCQGSLFA